MNKDLKKAIVNWMFENSTEFQLLNAATQKFRQYIYTTEGEFCYGGDIVYEFIKQCYALIRF